MNFLKLFLCAYNKRHYIGFCAESGEKADTVPASGEI